MKDFLLVCNLKMNVVPAKSYKQFFDGKQYKGVVICPNFCDIKDYVSLAKTSKILVGAQNVSEFDAGAYTGEVSAQMLKNAGVSYCIVGHSERKQHNFETLSQINLKAKMLLKYNITPIICVGEEIFKGTEFASKYVLLELNQILQGIDAQKVVVAYEPIWAIGSGNVPTNQHIQEVLFNIKKFTNASKTLYGGSFNQNNFKQIANISSVDGALIGGASLHPDIICKIKNELD